MWELICEDTFGFGEDRDPVKVECMGEDILDGFTALWYSVLNESIAGTPEKPVSGFSAFTLLIKMQGCGTAYISIDTNKYLNELSILKQRNNPDAVKNFAIRHHESFTGKSEDKFWSSLADYIK